jgi:hypothetical protein
MPSFLYVGVERGVYATSGVPPFYRLCSTPETENEPGIVPARINSKIKRM